MQGKATIILKDEKTGRIVKQLEEHNMVTKAVEKLFDLPKYALLRGWNASATIRSVYMPIFGKIMGGVMLLGDYVMENVNNLYLPGNFKPIATAGGAYAGTNTARGSCNINESGPTDNGYRLVWDFPTDKANGTIKCLAITDREFADAGFACSADSSGGFIRDLEFNGFTNYIGNAYALKIRGRFLCNPEPDLFVFYQYEKTNGNERHYIRKYRTIDSERILIADSVTDYQDVRPESETEISLQFSLALDDACYYFDTNGILYLFGWERGDVSDKCVIKYAGIDVETGEILSQRSVNVLYTSRECSHYAVHDKKLYISNPYGIYVYSLETEECLSCTYMPVNGGHGYFYTFYGKLMFAYPKNTSNSETWHYFLDCDTPVHTKGMFGYIVHGENLHTPYVFFSYNFKATEMTDLKFALATNYMATINNLSEPIEKTSRHALQIRYELTNG